MVIVEASLYLGSGSTAMGSSDSTLVISRSETRSLSVQSRGESSFGSLLAASDEGAEDGSDVERESDVGGTAAGGLAGSGTELKLGDASGSVLE